jgi:sugar phosphate isomerase/epimerase
VFVACSTLCFARYPLEEALDLLSEVADDVHHAAARLRHGPGLAPAAFSLHIDAPDTREWRRQFQAVCRLARISTVPLVTMEAGPAEPEADSDAALDAEARRLGQLMELADGEGILLSVATLTGTLTEMPDDAVALCERVPGLGLTLDPSHYLVGPNQGKPFDQVFPHVRHVHLRDTGRGPEQFQVCVGQGQVEYGRLVAQLARHGYDRLLTVDIRDIPDAPFAMEPEVRKLKYLLESLV